MPSHSNWYVSLHRDVKWAWSGDERACVGGERGTESREFMNMPLLKLPEATRLTIAGRGYEREGTTAEDD